MIGVLNKPDGTSVTITEDSPREDLIVVIKELLKMIDRLESRNAMDRQLLGVRR